MANDAFERGKKAAEAVRAGAEAGANAVHGAASSIAKHEQRVADGAESATSVVGSGLKGLGAAATSSGKVASDYLHANADAAASRVQKVVGGESPGAPGWRKGAGKLAGALTKGAAHTGGWLGSLFSVAGKGVHKSGEMTAKVAPAVGGALGGVVRGVPQTVSSALDSVALTEKQLTAMLMRLRELGQEDQARAQLLLTNIMSAQRGKRKDELLDMLVVGGVTLAEAIRHPEAVTEEVQHAFALAYPGLAETETFSDAVARMSPDELVGLASGVKGKLFEIQLADHLNGGELPDGFHAVLADSPTQEGWDIQILDADGHVNDLLQAKATDSISYIQHALDQYPEIDVVTTDEVYAQLLSRHLAEQVADSGISLADLKAQVAAAIDSGDAFHLSDLVPSALGEAVIALSVFMDRGATLREMGTDFGVRSSKASLSGAVGKAALILTHTWWLALVAGVGSRYLVGTGYAKRERYQALKKSLETMERRQQLAFKPGPA